MNTNLIQCFGKKFEKNMKKHKNSSKLYYNISVIKEYKKNMIYKNTTRIEMTTLIKITLRDGRVKNLTLQGYQSSMKQELMSLKDRLVYRGYDIRSYKDIEVIEVVADTREEIKIEGRDYGMGGYVEVTFRGSLIYRGNVEDYRSDKHLKFLSDTYGTDWDSKYIVTSDNVTDWS